MKLNMTSVVYTKEQLNYFRICYIATNVVPEGLRLIFKQEWDNRYKRTRFGEWKDTLQNGRDFYEGESKENQERNKDSLTTMINGNSQEWDCTMLFYAILHSDCIYHLRGAVRSSVHIIREFRNLSFAHVTRGQLSDPEFQHEVRRIQRAFQSIGLSTIAAKIQAISTQKSFPTEELRGVMAKHRKTAVELQTSERRRRVLEDQLQNDASSFCILPPKPSHEIAARDCEVAKITQQLNKLKNVNESGLSYLYITGNPGSGKSQLAGLVAKKIYDEAIKDLDTPSFVMTLNAESLETLLETYVSLARQIKCPEDTVTDTRNSKEIKTDEKINNLKDLIATKIQLFASWLQVVDNVTSVSLIHDFLPQPGNEQWSRGQLLITTQYTLCIPSESSFVSHTNISNGMELRDASCFLAMISGINDQEMEQKVAKALDYQPLALASAGTYVKKIRESKVCATFGWKECLEKLEKGMRTLTEKELTNTNPSYPKSMTAATRLAVERAMTSESVVKNAFTFLSVCSPQPLHLDILMNYILNVEKDRDREEIGIHIQGYSLLLFEERGNGVFIRLHQVVHDVIKCLTKEQPVVEGYSRIVDVAVRSFNQFIAGNLSDTWSELDSITDSRHLISHLTALVVEIKNVVSDEGKYQVFKESVLSDSHYLVNFERLGKICQNHSEFSSAKGYYDVAFKLVETSETCSDIDAAGIYGCLGGIHHAMGDLQLAKKNLERALTIYLQNPGPENVGVAQIYNNLGDVERALGELQQAKSHSERALAIQLKNLGPEHVEVARIYRTLGTIQYDLGELQLAKEHYEHALDILLKKYGPQHIDVSRNYNNLGRIHYRLGDMEQAKQHYECSLAIKMKKLGPEHVDVASTCHNLGLVHHDLADLQKAADYYKRALDIKLKKCGPEHPDLASTYYNLSLVQKCLGGVQQAKEYYEEAQLLRQKNPAPEHVAITSTNDNLVPVHNDLADLYRAKERYERTLDIFLEASGPEHVDVAQNYKNLGRIHHALGDMQQAKKHHQHALAIYLKKLGPEHVTVATTYNYLGAVQYALGNHQEALEHHERALAILKKTAHEDVDVATTYKNLGNAHMSLGDLHQAKEHFECALEIYLKQVGPEDIYVARIYNNLGILHRKFGDLQQAKENCERAIDIKLKALGPDHVDVARTYNNLGVVQHDLGDLQQAKQHYKHALDIQQKKLGPDHVDVARTYNNLGLVQRDLGDLQQAKQHYKHALDIQLKELGPDHVDVARTHNNLGAVQHELGDLQQAKENCERAIDIKLKALGPGHTILVSSYLNLGHVFCDLGDLSQAKEHCEHALHIQLKKLGPDHVDVARTYNNLGVVQRDLGDLQQAKQHYKHVLDIQLKELGPDHVDVARTHNNLGAVQHDLGDLQQAKENFESALVIRLKKLGPDHVDVARTYNNLGALQGDMGDLQHAKANFERALDIMQKKLRPDHVHVTTIYNTLAALQHDLGDLQ